MEVEAKAAFANLQKRYQKRRITLRRPKKLEQGSKEVEKPINGFKDHEFFQQIDDFMSQRVSKTHNSSTNISTNSILKRTDDFEDGKVIYEEFCGI